MPLTLKSRYIILVLPALLLSIGQKAWAQDSLVADPYHHSGFGPLVAYRGIGPHMLEAGILHASIGHGIEGYELSFLHNLSPSDPVAGVSVGIFRGFAYFEAGANLTWLTDFDDGMLYLRPAFGLGAGGYLTLGYGYSLPLGRDRLKGTVSRHQLRLVCRWPVQAM